MGQQTFRVTGNAEIKIRACHNRVTVVGWDDAHSVAVDSAARQDGDTILVENASKVTLRVPRAAILSITDCEADVRVDDLTGAVLLADIDGDVALRNLRGETIARDIDGDLVAKDVVSLKGQGKWDGDVALRGVKNIVAEKIEGEASLSEITTASLQSVEGDVVVKNCQTLTIETCEGDVVLRNVAAATIKEIEGDANLGQAGETTLETLGGDFVSQAQQGSLTIDEIEGNVNLRDVTAPIQIERVGGDFIASGVCAAIHANDIEGDAVISFAAIATLNLSAEGDVVINLPESANAQIELAAPRGDLVVRANLNVAEQDESHMRGTLGNGGVTVQAESTEGDLILRASGSDARGKQNANYAEYGELGNRIASEVRQSIQESLGEFGIRERHGKHHFGFTLRHAHDHARNDAPREPAPVEKSRGPEAGSPERQALLDAIARGELSVDDAIKKLSGEE